METPKRNNIVFPLNQISIQFVEITGEMIYSYEDSKTVKFQIESVEYQGETLYACEESKKDSLLW